MILFKKKKLIFFPIESTSRELEIRRSLAKEITKKNDVIVIILEQQLLRILSKMIFKSIYFGKHFFSKPKFADRWHYNLLKKNKSILFYLHEEGVFPGNEESWKRFLDNMMNPSILHKDDYLLLWSEWQKDHFLKSTELKCKVEVTGHPRFDLYKALKHDTKKYKFLINTSFSYPNNIQGKDFIFSGKNKSYNFKKDADHIFNNYFTQCDSLTWVERCVYQLSLLYPSELIVIRPHPSENGNHYKSLFATLKNVKVIKDELIGDALAKSEALIQIGCTTAVESHLAGIPTFTNKNIGQSRAEISNDLSHDLQLPIDKDPLSYVMNKIDESVINKHAFLTLANLKPEFNSIDKIVQLISSELSSRKSYTYISMISRILLALFVYRMFYWPFKLIYYLFKGRLKEFSDFKSRYRPGKKSPNSIRLSKYVEIIS